MKIRCTAHRMIHIVRYCKIISSNGVNSYKLHEKNTFEEMKQNVNIQCKARNYSHVKMMEYNTYL